MTHNGSFFLFRMEDVDEDFVEIVDESADAPIESDSDYEETEEERAAQFEDVQENGTFKKISKNFQKIFKKFSKNFQKIFKKFSKNIFKLFLFTRTSRRVRTSFEKKGSSSWGLQDFRNLYNFTRHPASYLLHFLLILF